MHALASFVAATALVAVASAQGSGPQLLTFPPGPARNFTPSSTCTTDQEFKFYGCFDLSGGYDLTIEGPPLNTVSRVPIDVGPSYFPGWVDTGSAPFARFFENSVTPGNCTTACRGHGYRFAALANKSCHCGSYPPPLPLGIPANPNLPAGNECFNTNVQIGSCPGDHTQQC